MFGAGHWTKGGTKAKPPPCFFMTDNSSEGTLCSKKELKQSVITETKEGTECGYHQECGMNQEVVQPHKGLKVMKGTLAKGGKGNQKMQTEIR